jgi:branched-chain amino acid transport system ATP-binding protein
MTEILSLDRLNKAFGRVTVAKDVTLRVADSECVGVIGPNGAGKSSIFALIAGALAPDSGTIRLMGHDVTTLPAHARVRAGIGRAFQIPQPFAGLTVYENILSAAASGAGLRGGELTDWAVEVTRSTGLAHRADTLAGSLTLIDRKNLELARALATRARLLMLDEIGAGLTEREVARLTERIGELAKDHAVIWIEHIPHALRQVANRIVVLNFGEVVAEGPPSQVMNLPVVREIYMGLKETAP